MYDDSDDDSDIDEGNKAVQILTRLLSEQSTELNHSTDGADDSDECVQEMEPLETGRPEEATLSGKRWSHWKLEDQGSDLAWKSQGAETQMVEREM